MTSWKKRVSSCFKMVRQGSLCRSFCQPEFGAERPNPDLMKSWKKRVSSCFKVPEDSEVKSSSPLIGVVDYPAHTPRSLANVDSLVQHLQTRLEGHDVRLQHFTIGRASSMEEIASVYNSIDMLVQVECACLAACQRMQLDWHEQRDKVFQKTARGAVCGPAHRPAKLGLCVNDHCWVIFAAAQSHQ